MKRSEDVSNFAADKLSKAFSEKGSTLVLYCGNTEGLAQHLCTTVKVAKPSLNIAFFDGDYSYNILLPYVAEEVNSVVLLASPLEVGCTYRLLQSLSLLGLNTIALLPTVTVNKFRNYIEKQSYNVHVVDLDSELYRLAILQASIKTALAIARGEIARVKRLGKELDMVSIVRELSEMYSSLTSIAKTKKLSELSVAVSKSLLAAGEELMDRGIPVVVVGRHGLERKPPDILVYTSVEEPLINEYLSSLAKRGVKRNDISVIRVNTDPFTAPIYVLITFYATVVQ